MIDGSLWPLVVTVSSERGRKLRKLLIRKGSGRGGDAFEFSVAASCMTQVGDR